MGFVFFVFCALTFVIAAAYASGPVPITIEQRPEVVAILMRNNMNVYTHSCLGTLLNNNQVLTSAACIVVDGVTRFSTQFRAGSSSWKSGGTVYSINRVTHPALFDWQTLVNDAAVIRANEEVLLSDTVQPGLFASGSYFVPDNVPLQSVGWSYLTVHPQYSENVQTVLHQQQLTSVNRQYCDHVYYTRYGRRVSSSMICSWPAQSTTTDRYKCYGEAGGPLYYNEVVVGIRSFDPDCFDSNLPTINSRVSSFTWLLE